MYLRLCSLICFLPKQIFIYDAKVNNKSTNQNTKA